MCLCMLTPTKETSASTVFALTIKKQNTADTASKEDTSESKIFFLYTVAEKSYKPLAY